MPGPTGRLRRGDRVRRSSEYRRIGRIGRGGRRVVEPAFVLLVAPSPADPRLGSQRLGITMSRKVGDAVVRNRLKRCVREWFRHSRYEFESGIDLVVIGRSAAAGLSCREIEGILCGMALRVGAKRA